MTSRATGFDAVFGSGRGTGVATPAVIDKESLFWSQGGYDAPVEMLQELVTDMDQKTLLSLLSQPSGQGHGENLVQAVVAARMTPEIIKQRVEEVWDICFSDDYDLPATIEKVTEATLAEAEAALMKNCFKGKIDKRSLTYIGERSVVGRTSKSIAQYLKGNEDEVVYHITGDGDWQMSISKWEHFARVCTTLTDSKLKQYFRDCASKPKRDGFGVDDLRDLINEQLNTCLSVR